jgi:hypothetical protein
LHPNWWNKNFSTTQSTDDTGVSTTTVSYPSIDPSIPDTNFLIQVYTQPMIIKPFYLDYGNTKKANTKFGFHTVIDPLGKPAYMLPDNTCPGNTVPGVYWTNYMINGKQSIAPQLKKNNEFHAWHPTTDFDFNYSHDLENDQIAVIHLDSYYQKGDRFSQTCLTNNSDCENFILGANKNAEMYREHLLLMQYEFTVDIKDLELPYTTFVMYNSYYGGNITFLNSTLDENNNKLPMLNNNACDLNYGNIANQITIDINGKPRVIPTTIVFVDSRAILASISHENYKFTNTKLYNVKPQLDSEGIPIRGVLEFNSPSDGPLDSLGNVTSVTGFLVDLSTLPPLPAFPQAS